MIRKAALLAFLGGELMSGHAYAAYCTVAATPLVFGTYRTTLNAPLSITATIYVTCSSATADMVSYEIHLAPGSSGTFASRTMSGGAAQLVYQLYTTPAMVQVWGDGTNGTSIVRGSFSLSAGAPRTASYTVYGRIAGRQNAVPDTYRDPVTVLLVVN